MARAVFPLGDPRKLAALLLVLPAGAAAGCGGSGDGETATEVQIVRGPGYRFAAPVEWRVARAGRAVQARSGEALVSVTTFPLARRYEPALWKKVVPELDRVARELASRSQGELANARTEEVAGRNARIYEIERGDAQQRIGFVLEGRREYQLFCSSADEACRRLFESFRLLG